MDFPQSLNSHSDTGLFYFKKPKSEKIANFRTFLLKYLRHLSGVQYHSETFYVIYYHVIKAIQKTFNFKTERVSLKPLRVKTQKVTESMRFSIKPHVLNKKTQN